MKEYIFIFFWNIIQVVPNIQIYSNLAGENQLILFVFEFKVFKVFKVCKYDIFDHEIEPSSLHILII